MSAITKFSSLLTYTRENGLAEGLAFTQMKIRAAMAQDDLLWKFAFEKNPLIKTGNVEDYSNQIESVWQELKTLPGVTPREWQVDAAKYRQYICEAKYEAFDPYYRGGSSGDAEHRSEKLLQHFISLELLSVNSGDVFIDIASNTSPMRHIVKRLFGATTYSLDLSYPAGINGDLIGADAGNIPLPDGSVSKMTLHCSFEHFAYGSDIRFVKECSRILQPGGRVCIIPLYVLPDFVVRVDPTLEMSLGASDLEGAELVYVRDYNVDYGRFYSPTQFAKRIVANAAGLTVELYRIRGLETLGESNVYSHLALILSRPPNA